jgi:hypothetical protein
MMHSWLRVSARAGSAWAPVMRLLDKRDRPQPSIGIERASTRLGVLRRGKHKRNTSQQASRRLRGRPGYAASDMPGFTRSRVRRRSADPVTSGGIPFSNHAEIPQSSVGIRMVLLHEISYIKKHSVRLHQSRGGLPFMADQRIGKQYVVFRPTVSLDLISLVASSCGYCRGHIEPRAAH